ncbi:MAG TPA: phage holin family protein [Candidatus Krumholzibacteria bacterium]|nr:phage holin family protein [Candidatus Krumholzibacteria bacterium]
MGRSARSLYSVVRRVAALWAVEVGALWAMARVLPGLSLEGWSAAVIGVAVIALLNALVRPLLLYLTLPFTVLSFGLLTLAINAVIVSIAALVVPGLHIAEFATGVVVALGLSVVNTVAASLLAFNDEDSVYRNIARRIARHRHPMPEGVAPGIVFVEIDGLAFEALARATGDGHLPTLASWIRSGSHRVLRWDCGVPSQTSSSQAGILFGNNFDIPGFRWYEKSTGKLVVSNDPSDAAHIEQRVSRGAGLLRLGGLSVCNMFTGDAEKNVAIISTFSSPARQVRKTSSLYFSFYVNPYNFTRALVLMLREIVIERWEAFRQHARDLQPRVSRGGSYPLLRAMSTVAQRELGTYTLMREMFAGVPSAYITYVGYDVVAHHAGPERPDALRILHDLDRQVAILERAARDGPRPYRFVVLSDHGQTASIPFRQRHGTTIDQLVQSLVSKTRRVRASTLDTEGWGHVNALLSEAISHDRLSGRAARRILRARTRGGYVELGNRRKREASHGDVVVCSSGNLGLVYFDELADRLTLEALVADHPGLIEGLIAHEGIGFVMVRSHLHGPVAMGRGGVHYLREHRVDGSDPLADYGPHAASQLMRLDGFPHCGDVVVNGRYHPSIDQVESFEEMVGAHGGLGGAQTHGFLLYPSQWAVPEEEIANAEDVYQLFVRWRDTLASGADPSAARVDALQ